VTEARLYLVAYDIASPKRWRGVVKRVKKLGHRVQLSVFLCRATPRRIHRLEEELRRILNPTEDRLLIADLGVPTGEDTMARLKSLDLPAGFARLGATIV
jgi:CRISPR-associated protein Cas2